MLDHSQNSSLKLILVYLTGRLQYMTSRENLGVNYFLLTITNRLHKFYLLTCKSHVTIRTQSRLFFFSFE